MIRLSLENFFQLNATVESEKFLHAFYLYKGNEVQEKTKYTSDTKVSFNLNVPGSYRVKVFNKSRDGVTESSLSESIRFNGFREVNHLAPRQSIGIVGVSRNSSFIAHVFEIRHDVDFFIDPTGEFVNKQFFGRPILANAPNGPHVRLIGHEKYLREFPSMEPFAFSAGSSDALARELHSYGAMELYRISRRTHLAGLREGAMHIREFIFHKFSSQIPFESVIGEGTRLGYGGIGTVIHPDSIIGKNCVIGQNVTLGGRAGGNGTPVIGDNVWISPGAKCFGGKIGNNVIIGANAVVLNEVSDNSVVAGVPARVISTNVDKYSGYFQKKVSK